MSSTNSLFDNKLLSDVMIKFGQNEEMLAHKQILAGKSTYFFKAFTGGFSVASSSEVNLGDDEEPQVIRAMLRHMYDLAYDEQTGTDEPCTDIRFHISVFMAADKYDIPTLRAKVIGKFDKLMDMSENRDVGVIIPEIKRVYGPEAVQAADDSLQRAAGAACAKHLVDLRKHDEFMDALKKGDPFMGQLLVELLLGRFVGAGQVLLCSSCYRQYGTVFPTNIGRCHVCTKLGHHHVGFCLQNSNV